MKNRLISLLLAAVMLLAAIPTVRASQFTDLNGHWATDYIEQVVSLGLFGGTGATTFSPDESMTRGMFVTVLGRLQNVDKDYWSSSAMPKIFQDVSSDSYYAPYICWAVCNGIVNGTGGKTFSPEESITREQMAKMVAFYLQRLGHGVVPDSDSVIPRSFADEGSISSWALESVDLLRVLGLMNGSEGADGRIYFQPQKTLTRAECATVFCRLYQSLVFSDAQQTSVEQLELNQSDVSLLPGATCTLTAKITPSQASGARLVWRTSNEQVVTVSDTGVVTCVGIGTADVSVYASNGKYATCRFTCNANLASANETYNEKCIRVFGRVVDDPRLVYTTSDGAFDYAAAAADMVSITVRVWDIGSNGTKYTNRMTLKVHKNLAATVACIFEDIYNGQEKFPIHALGGYSQGGKSEHTIGCAIDINPNENYYCDPSGNAIVGDHWLPGSDPYSIPLDGEVAKIFARYGFKQGAYWNSGYRDYMHFSYFGT